MKRSCAAIHPMPPSTITKRSFGKRCGTAEVISSARLRCIINIFLSQTGQDGGEQSFRVFGLGHLSSPQAQDGFTVQHRSRSLTGRQAVTKRDGLPTLGAAA